MTMTSLVDTTDSPPIGPGDTEPSEAVQLLWYWLRHKTPISYAYSRAGGELLETGAGVVGGMDKEYLELRTSDSTLITAIRAAQISVGQQRFFGPLFLSSRLIDGVSIQLASGDWFFVCPRQDQDLFAHGHPLERA